VPLVPDARRAYLDDACADDPALRAEVMHLLAFEDRAAAAFDEKQRADVLTAKTPGMRGMQRYGPSSRACNREIIFGPMRTKPMIVEVYQDRGVIDTVR
jgi:hypothetical protein